MPTAKETLALIITGDSRGAVKALDQVGQKADKEFGRAKTAGDKWSKGTKQNFAVVGDGAGGVGSSLKGMVDQFGGVRTIAFAAAGAVAAFGVKAVKAAAEGEGSNARLRVAIQNAGGSIEDYQDRIDGVSRKMARFGFENDAVEESVARLLPATKDVGKALALQGVAADVAAARGISLADATNLLVKAQNGNAGALVRVGILSKATAKDLKDGDAIVKKLAETYRGSAAAAASTFEGRLKALKAEGANLTEQLGNFLLPSLTGMATVLEATANKGQSFLAWEQEVADNSGLLGKALDVSKDAILSLATGGASRLFSAFGEIGNSTDHVKEATEELAAATRDYAQDVAPGSTASDKELAEGRKRVADASEKVKAITDAVAGATEQSTAATDEATSAGAAHADALEIETKRLKEAETASESYRDAVTGVRDAQRAQFAANVDLVSSLADYKKQTDEATAAGGKNAEQNLEAAEAYNKATAAIDKVGDAAVTTAEQQRGLAAGSLKSAEKTDVQVAALTKLRDFIQPGNPLRAYLDGLIDALNRAAQDRHATLRISVSQDGRGITSKGLDFLAEGGPARKDTPYIVGEDGPELFVPDRSGVVIPNGARTSKVGIAAGSPSNVVNLYVAINNPTGNGDEIGRQLVRSLESGTNRQALQRILVG